MNSLYDPGMLSGALIIELIPISLSKIWAGMFSQGSTELGAANIPAAEKLGSNESDSPES